MMNIGLNFPSLLKVLGYLAGPTSTLFALVPNLSTNICVPIFPGELMMRRLCKKRLESLPEVASDLRQNVLQKRQLLRRILKGFGEASLPLLLFKRSMYLLKVHQL